ncbi:hypothetical protein J7L65_05905 [Candidatus Bathyarchaeota archaeon]|nr:hypothetical protein [Candidatus Bathyarchaeota archaeon]
MRIRFRSPSIGSVEAEMTGENPKTAEAVWDALPIEGVAERWGDEVYFSTPIELGEENARERVEVGEVAYWPPGRAICIFFGSTPVSRGGEIRAASPVNVFARILGDATIFRKVRMGERILVERA